MVLGKPFVHKCKNNWKQKFQLKKAEWRHCEPETRVFSEERQIWGVVMFQNIHKGPDMHYCKFTPLRSGWHHFSDICEPGELFAYCWDRHKAGQI